MSPNTENASRHFSIEQFTANCQDPFFISPYVPATRKQLHRAITTANQLSSQRRWEEAVRGWLAVLSMLSSMNGVQLNSRAHARSKLGSALNRLGRHREAEFVLSGALAATRGKLSAIDARVLSLLQELITACFGLGHHERLVKLLTEAEQACFFIYGPHSKQCMRFRSQLANAYFQTHRWDEAAAIYKEVIETERYASRTGDGIIAMLNNLGISLVRLRRFDEARPYWEEALRRLIEKYGEDDERTRNAACYLNGLKR